MGNMNFENLGLCSEIQKAVKYMGFEERRQFRQKQFRLFWKEKISLVRRRQEPERQRHSGFHFYRKSNPEKTKSCKGLFFARQENSQYRCG